MSDNDSETAPNIVFNEDFISPLGGQVDDIALIGDVEGDGPEEIILGQTANEASLSDEIRKMVEKSDVVDEKMDESSQKIERMTSNEATAALVRAEAVYNASVQEHEKARRRNPDDKWLKTVTRSGTLSDRLAALTLAVQTSPTHTLEALESLLQLAGKKSKREFMMATDALVDLWINTLLPDIKLKSFREQDWANAKSDEELASMYQQDALKTLYSSFITTLNARSHDTVIAVRLASLKAAQMLIAAKPEREELLLSLIVNKLGDPEKQVASRAAYLLQILCQKHPNMMDVVCGEVERFIFRPQVGQRAQYYAITFLNQLVLSNSKRDLARRLINIYFTLFDAYSNKGEIDTKMLGAVLTGINRAFPFAQSDPKTYMHHVDSLLKGSHIAPFNTAVQSLSLLFNVMVAGGVSSDRVYRAVYDKINDATFLYSSHQSTLLNLLFRCMKIDPSKPRVYAFIRRILQIACHAPFSLSASILLLVSEVSHLRSDISIISRDDGDSKAYDPSKREPQHCNAEGSVMVELDCLSRHVHPSVSIFAKKLINGQDIDYRGDPLHDFTLMSFLDRLAFKQPKSHSKPRGMSLMQPDSVSVSAIDAPANTVEFAARKTVVPHEAFMQQYVKQKTALTGDGRSEKHLTRTERRRIARGDEGERKEESEDEGSVDLDQDIDEREFAKAVLGNDAQDDEFDDEIEDGPIEEDTPAEGKTSFATLEEYEQLIGTNPNKDADDDTKHRKKRSKQ